MNALPIPAATAEQQAEIVRRVDAILAAKKRHSELVSESISKETLKRVQGDSQQVRGDSQQVRDDTGNADTSAAEREIDAAVYKLYGLTEEEIAAVEGK